MSGVDWKALVDLLMSPYGRIDLLCDGYVVQIQMERASKTAVRYEPAVYVDGTIRFRDDDGNDLTKGEGEVSRRFWCPRSMPVAARKYRDNFKRSSKSLQKRLRAMGPAFDPDAKVTFYSPVFKTPGAVARHIKRTCDQVHVLSSTREKLDRVAAIREAERHAS